MKSGLLKKMHDWVSIKLLACDWFESWMGSCMETITWQFVMELIWSFFLTCFILPCVLFMNHNGLSFLSISTYTHVKFLTNPYVGRFPYFISTNVILHASQNVSHLWAQTYNFLLQVGTSIGSDSDTCHWVWLMHMPMLGDSLVIVQLHHIAIVVAHLWTLG